MSARWLVVVCVVFGGCLAESPVASDAEQMAWQEPAVDVGPPAGVTLTPEQIYTAGSIDLTATGLASGQSALFAVSLSGTGVGPCSRRLGGACLDLLEPIVFLGDVAEDGTGTSHLVVPVPRAPAGTEYWFQAIARTVPGGADVTLSNTVSVISLDLPAVCIDDHVSDSAPGGECPAECTGGCVDATCIIDCNGLSDCQSDVIICPDGLNCELECGGISSCQGATITCPLGATCDIFCSNTSACQGAVATGSDGAFRVDCSSTSTCQGMQQLCGFNLCEATCTGLSASIEQRCGASCDCTATGC